MSNYNPVSRPFRYEDIDKMMYSKNGRVLFTRKVRNNTWLERRPEGVAVRLHGTDVVLWHSDGTISLNTGGWPTVTTRSRINDWLPYTVTHTERGSVFAGIQVESDHGLWIVRHMTAWTNGVTKSAFHDGIVVDSISGSLWSTNPDASLADIRKDDAEIEKLINTWLTANTFRAPVNSGYRLHETGNTTVDDFRSVVRQLLTDTDQILLSLFIETYQNPRGCRYTFASHEWVKHLTGGKEFAKIVHTSFFRWHFRNWIRDTCQKGVRSRRNSTVPLHKAVLAFRAETGVDFQDRNIQVNNGKLFTN